MISSCRDLFLFVLSLAFYPDILIMGTLLYKCSMTLDRILISIVGLNYMLAVEFTIRNLLAPRHNQKYNLYFYGYFSVLLNSCSNLDN